jgi:16S rRNA (cytosine1402-N4)-methyltransferase
MTGSAHRSVLLEEAVRQLTPRPDGIYVDATFGRGGHSELILSRLGSDGRLCAIDRDPEAIDVARERFGADPRFQIWHGSFADLAAALRHWGLDRVDGVLMDLGVSSPQLDDARRGFSFQHQGPLDMRMDPTAGVSAAEWLAKADEADIARVLWEFGEERQSRRIARAIVSRRGQEPIETTLQLANLIASVIRQRQKPGGKSKHPATRSFQAIRIFINDELGALDQGLEAAVEALNPGGRLVVISFHSLEDRRVKHFIRQQSTQPGGGRRLPLPETVELRLKRVGGATMPGDAEVEENPRARSAVLRVAERLP